MDLKSTNTYSPAKTIDEVLLQLDEIIAQTIDEDSYLCAFVYVYRRTTFEIKKAIEAQQFEDPPRMEKMDVMFANLFIAAFNKYQRSTITAKSWRLAFNSSGERLAIVQHIMLSMNAHINYDLPVAAASVAKGKEIIQLKNDFMKINQILAGLTDVMQKGLGKVSIFMKLLDVFGFRSDEKIINFSIKKARDFAWLNAMELALLQGDVDNIRIEELDRRVVQIGNMIKNPPGKLLSFILKLISITERKNKKIIIDKISKA